MKDNLASSLYEAIKLDYQPRVFEHWHASSIADCPRAHYFKRLGITPTSIPGAGKMLRWKAGHLMEEAIRPYLEAVIPDIQSNVRLISKKLDLTGEYDNYSPENKTIYEIKSVHDFAFIYRKKDDPRFHLRDQQPYLNHQYQNHCYVLLLNESGEEVEFITYIYITLDGRIATYKTEVNKALAGHVRKRLALLTRAWKAQTPPDCLCNNKDHPLYKSTMQYCDYRGEECCDIKLIERNNNGRD